MAEARSALRQLVRSINANITSKTGNPVWRKAVFEEFRRHSGEVDAGVTALLVQEARDVAFYLESVRKHKVVLRLTRLHCRNTFEVKPVKLTFTGTGSM